MSRDCNYILSYESQMYTRPTPMELDRKLISAVRPGTEFTEVDYGFTLHCDLPKYGLPLDTIQRLKADAIFERVDGDPYVRILL